MFRNTTKQGEKLSLVDAMDNDSIDHEEEGHWSMIHRETLPNKSRPIKKI